MDDTTLEPPAMTGSWQHLRTSAEMIRQYAEQVMVLSVLPALVVQLGSFVQHRYSMLGIIIGAAGGLWLLINAPVLYYFEVNAVKGDAPTVLAAYREGLRYFWRILGLSIVTLILITLGLVFFIIPGAVLLRRYVLAPLYLVDRQLTIGEAMRQSAQDSAAAARYIWASLGVVAVVSLGIVVVGQTLRSVPGLPEVIITIVSVITLFVLPLRYKEVAAKHKKAVRSKRPS